MACYCVSIKRAYSAIKCKLSCLRKSIDIHLTPPDKHTISLYSLHNTISLYIKRSSAPIICAITRYIEKYVVRIIDTTPHPVVKMGIVCSINNQPILPEGISWSEDILSWDSSEGGVIKYNLLTSSGVWRIEELL